jgi:hypothetical protein
MPSPDQDLLLVPMQQSLSILNESENAVVKRQMKMVDEGLWKTFSSARSSTSSACSLPELTGRLVTEIIHQLDMLVSCVK